MNLNYKVSIILFFVLLIQKNVSYSLPNEDSLLTAKYSSALAVLDSLIKDNSKSSFKKAAFIPEEVFDKYSVVNGIEILNQYFQILKAKKENYIITAYTFNDSLNYFLNNDLFNFIYRLNFYKTNQIVVNYTTPFTYNFTDPQGDKDWTNTFVTKLLVTHKGNCRSLTYLYKILADELGAKCWLALAPNHIYIRNYSKQIGWYNTELTSGTFPTDAWIAATGYVNTDAIRSGVYMDTLSNQQSIGLCVMDLAQGYIKQTNNYTDSFVLKCCNLVLQYHSVNPEALLTKAEALKRIYLKQKEENNLNTQITYDEMEQTYIILTKLGYREMPYKAYQKWLKVSKQDKEKYLNKKLTNAIIPH